MRLWVSFSQLYIRLNSAGNPTRFWKIVYFDRVIFKLPIQIIKIINNLASNSPNTESKSTYFSSYIDNDK